MQEQEDDEVQEQEDDEVQEPEEDLEEDEKEGEQEPEEDVCRKIVEDRRKKNLQVEMEFFDWIFNTNQIPPNIPPHRFPVLKQHFCQLQQQVQQGQQVHQGQQGAGSSGIYISYIRRGSHIQRLPRPVQQQVQQVQEGAGSSGISYVR